LRTALAAAAAAATTGGSVIVSTTSGLVARIAPAMHDIRYVA
jgi:hypothetical protein